MTMLTRIEAIKDLIQEAIDHGATSAENIHKVIAGMPLEALSKRGLLHDSDLESIRATQEATVGVVYEAIRRVNKEVGDVASAVFEAIEDQITAQKNIGAAEKPADKA